MGTRVPVQQISDQGLLLVSSITVGLSTAIWETGHNSSIYSLARVYSPPIPCMHVGCTVFLLMSQSETPFFGTKASVHCRSFRLLKISLAAGVSTRQRCLRLPCCGDACRGCSVVMHAADLTTNLQYIIQVSHSDFVSGEDSYTVPG